MTTPTRRQWMGMASGTAATLVLPSNLLGGDTPLYEFGFDRFVGDTSDKPYVLVDLPPSAIVPIEFSGERRREFVVLPAKEDATGRANLPELLLLDPIEDPKREHIYSKVQSGRFELTPVKVFTDRSGQRLYASFAVRNVSLSTIYMLVRRATT